MRLVFLFALAALGALPAPDEVTQLFDGKTLNGWITSGGHYDGHASWTIEDGALTGRQGENGEGGLIYTAHEYSDFTLELEFRIEEPMDSGIFLDMVPGLRGYQVTIDTPKDGELGGIYSDGWLQHNPEGWKNFKKGEWNRLQVFAQHQAQQATVVLRARLNGELLVAYMAPEDPQVFARAGHIGLQVHGGQGMARETKVQYRRITLQGEALDTQPRFSGPPQALELSEAARLLGWRPLFDGKSLAGWEMHGDATGAVAKDGQIEITGGGGELATREDFKDFELSLEFQTSEMANSGVFLRAARDGSNPAYSGCEIQVLDDFNWERVSNSKLEPWQFCGSLYHAQAPKQKALKPIGEWNSYRIRYCGTQLRTELNGVELYDVDTRELKLADPPFEKRAKSGFIGLQRHGGASEQDKSWVRYRNLFVRPL
jgi:3-keto-disaccharide hydrolase